MRENLPLAAFQLCFEAGNWHVADRTFILYRGLRFWMINRFAPHASLPIRIARRITHHARPPSKPDGDILARRRYDSVVASEATVRSLKARLGGIVLSATEIG